MPPTPDLLRRTLSNFWRYLTQTTKTSALACGVGRKLKASHCLRHTSKTGSWIGEASSRWNLSHLQLGTVSSQVCRGTNCCRIYLTGDLAKSFQSIKQLSRYTAIFTHAAWANATCWGLSLDEGTTTDPPNWIKNPVRSIGSWLAMQRTGTLVCDHVNAVLEISFKAINHKGSQRQRRNHMSHLKELSDCIKGGQGNTGGSGAKRLHRDHWDCGSTISDKGAIIKLQLRGVKCNRRSRCNRFPLSFPLLGIDYSLGNFLLNDHCKFIR